MKSNAVLRVAGIPQPGYIYLVNAVGTNKFKIGKTKASVLRRITELQTGCPVRLRYVYHSFVEDMDRTEKELHLFFNSFRLVGEWFALTKPNVKECITLMRLVQVDEPFVSISQNDEPFASVSQNRDDQSYCPIPLGWRQAHPADITSVVRGVIVACIRAGWSQTRTIQEVFGITKSGNNPNYDLAREVFQQISKSIN